MPREQRIELSPTSPALDLAAQLVAAVQAELGPDISPEGLLAAALTMTRNAFAQHTRCRSPRTYLDGMAAAAATEIRGTAEAVMQGCGLPVEAAPLAYQNVADSFARSVSNSLNVRADGPTRMPMPGPSPEAS